jgi:hypothetical protein
MGGVMVLETGGVWGRNWVETIQSGLKRYQPEHKVRIKKNYGSAQLRFTDENPQA